MALDLLREDQARKTIQLGNSYTSMAPSHTLVANNLFERCNGEVEVISSKTNFNEFRNNVFFKSEGSLVTRHGNYCILDGNYFIGDDDSEYFGGIRLIGTGHWVTNNYFYKLKGQIFRSPLAVMNGIPKSPLNRYIQVTDVVIAHNSWIDCTSPLQFGVGSNIDEKDVLPASEIRSERPIRTLVSNNLIYNSKGDKHPIFKHDEIDGIDFKSNLINNQGLEIDSVNGLLSKKFDMSELEENVLIPSTDLPNIELHHGFEFEQIDKDIFGNSRMNKNVVGAVSIRPNEKPDIMNSDKYGPDWYLANQKIEEPNTHSINTVADLSKQIDSANNGDIIALAPGEYSLNTPLKIDKLLTIQSADARRKAIINYVGKENTSAFEMNPMGELRLNNIILNGEKKQFCLC